MEIQVRSRWRIWIAYSYRNYRSS